MTNAADEGEAFWEKLAEETATQYAAFCAYRDMGRARSLRKAAATFYAEDGDRTEAGGRPETGTSGQVARFKEWSRRHLWRDRAEAFDAEELRARSLRMRQHRDEMIDRHRHIALLGEKLVSKIMYELLRDERYVPVSVLSGLINSATQLHRLTLGEATERLETVGDADDQPPDFSLLTDEELYQLQAINDKLYGGG